MGWFSRLLCRFSGHKWLARKPTYDEVNEYTDLYILAHRGHVVGIGRALPVERNRRCIRCGAYDPALTLAIKSLRARNPASLLPGPRT